MYKLNNLFKVTPFIIVSFIHIVNQLHFLDQEMVHFDMPTYLVLGQDVLRGYLPYENQFEPKGPFLYYAYALLIYLAKGKLIFIKIINDFVILLISFVIIKIANFQNKNLFFSTALASLFVLLMSAKGLGQSAYSEIYALLPLSVAIYFYFESSIKKNKLYFCGFFIGVACLVHQGVGLFFLILLLLICIKFSKKEVLIFLIGFSIPVFFITIIYFIRDKLNLLLFGYIEFPLTATLQTFDNVYLHNFGHYLLQVSEGNNLVGPLIIFVIILFVYLLVTNIQNNYDLLLFNLTSLIFFYIASTYAVHHLIYLAFFTSISLINLDNKTLQKSLFVATLSVSLISISLHGTNSYNNFKNFNSLPENNYNFENIANEIELRFGNNPEILALDHIIILFYLDVQNFSYMTHPSINFEKNYNSTIKEGLNIDTDFNFLLSKNPDLIICNSYLLKTINRECGFIGYKLVDLENSDDSVLIYKLNT